MVGSAQDAATHGRGTGVFKVHPDGGHRIGLERRVQQHCVAYGMGMVTTRSTTLMSGTQHGYKLSQFQYSIYI